MSPETTLITAAGFTLLSAAIYAVGPDVLRWTLDVWHSVQVDRAAKRRRENSRMKLDC
jgi:hypothetical protein